MAQGNAQGTGHSLMSSLIDGLHNQKYMLLIGAVPVAVAFGLIARGPPPVPPVEQPLPVQQVRIISVDVPSFEQRWRPVHTFPIPVRVEKVLIKQEPAPEPVIEKPARIERVVRLKRDICTRHGMRKVQIGKRWRCKR